MNNIEYSFVDEYLSRFTNSLIPIRFIDVIYIEYHDNSTRLIDGDDLRRMYPKDNKTTAYQMIRSASEIKEMEVRVDKQLVYSYLLEMENAMVDIVAKSVSRYLEDKKKGT